MACLAKMKRSPNVLSSIHCGMIAPPFSLKGSMNLLVGLGLIVCLFVSEMGDPRSVDDLWVTLLVLAVVCMAVPGMALFQAWFLKKRRALEDVSEQEALAIWNRMSVCHTGVWLIASVMIVSSLRWHDVVRTNLGLGSVPFLDDMLLLLPIVLSVFGSWWIHSSMLQMSSRSGPKSHSNSPSNQSRESGIGLLRIRLVAGAVLLPLGSLVLIKDVSSGLMTGDAWASGSGWFFGCLVGSLLGIAFAFAYPHLLMWVWPTREMEDERLATRIRSFCDRNRLGVRSIRVLDTGMRVSNALVFGFWPTGRVILVSDQMLATFSPDQTMAVIRHEAGHIRHRHFAQRLVWFLLPVAVGLVASLLLVFLGVWDGATARRFWVSSPAEITAGTFLSAMMVLSTTMVYFWFFVRRRLFEMEWEADEWSCRRAEDVGVESARRQMVSTLERMACEHPAGLEGGSLVHPSYASRIERLAEAATRTSEAVARTMSSAT